MASLAGPNVHKNLYCHIPECDEKPGCPSNTTRCLECIQVHGAHEKALRNAGCTDAEVTRYCDDLGKPHTLTGMVALRGFEAKQVQPKYDGPLFREDSLCFCDAGYTGADCSQKLTKDSSASSEFDGQLTTVAVQPESATDHVMSAARSTGTHTEGQQVTETMDSRVICPDGRASCPSGSSCAALSTGAWGCCATPNAVICDCSFCCPEGFACNTTGGVGSATHCEKQ